MPVDPLMRLLRRVSLSGVSAVVAFGAMPAFAHPGHVSAYRPDSVAHYLTSPVHLTALGAVVVIGVMGIVRWSRLQSRGARHDRKALRRPPR